MYETISVNDNDKRKQQDACESVAKLAELLRVRLQDHRQEVMQRDVRAYICRN